MPNSSSHPAPSAWIYVQPGAQPQRIFGLSPAERLRRSLRAAGVTEVVESDEPPRLRPHSTLVALRADWIVDERLVQGLVASRCVALRDPATGTLVGAAVPVERAAALMPWLRAGARPSESELEAAGLRAIAPETLAPAYTAALRSATPATVIPLAGAGPRELERVENLLFAAAYKGVTDVVTKWLWPRPARFVVRRLAQAGVTPNAVTLWSWGMVALAALLFWCGWFATGLAAAWLMTFLDTVDGKLARVTLQTSRLGHVLDHGLDLTHPPVWWAAFAAGLGAFAPGAAPGLVLAAWVVIAGYLVGRAIEGLFLLAFKIEIHSWRPLDSWFRGITARRNPNLVLLSAGVAAGRPDVGFFAVAAWTALCIVFHLVRLLKAFSERRAGRAVAPWFAQMATAVLLALALLFGPSARAAWAAEASASRLASGEFATEYWDLTIRLDSGHVVLAEFLLTNLGFGDRNAAVTGLVVAPDGQVTRFRQGKSDGEWTLSDDGRRLQVGKATLDQSGSLARLLVDRKKVRLDLQLGDEGAKGAHRPAALARAGYDLDLLESAAPVSGTLWLTGMDAPLEVKGRGALVHRSMDVLESRLVQRRSEAFVAAGGVSLYLLDVRRPDGGSARWLVAERAGQPILATDKLEIHEIGPPSEIGEERGYAVPRELRLSGPRISGKIRLGPELARYAPLADLPGPVRAAVALAANPLRRWSDATFEVEIQPEAGGAPLRVGGAGLVEVTFLNPDQVRAATPGPLDTGE